MRKGMVKFAVLAALTLPAIAGCPSWGSFQTNVWKGFGYSIGAFPANVITQWINAQLITAGVLPAT